jgi:transcriptional regulator NrdR family protein
MALAIDVVKQSGKRPVEQYDADKLLRSIRAACLSVRSPEGEAESTALLVTNAVTIWVTTKPAITSHDLRRQASIHLQRYHPEAAYLYQHHRAII